MWAAGWSALFNRQTADTVPETTARIHETGLFAAHWGYQTHGETHRLSCSHLHTYRHQAEQCARTLNAQVERMLREQNPNVIGAGYVAARLYRNPDHQYLGVHKEQDID